MPFTFAHPSIVLPLALLPTKKISITGLVIGSMSPDFFYFFSLSDKGYFGHSWVNMFLMDLPTAFILSYLYHLWVKEPLTNNLPKVFRRKLDIFLQFHWHHHVQKHFLSVIFSILLGISSHLVWDTFTHFNPFAFKLFPFMLRPVRISDTYVIGLFVLFWHLSTIPGMTVVSLVIYNLPAYKTANLQPPIFAFWKIAFVGFVLIVTGRTIYNPHYKNLQEIGIVTIGALIWSIIVACTYSFLKKYI